MAVYSMGMRHKSFKPASRPSVRLRKRDRLPSGDKSFERRPGKSFCRRKLGLNSSQQNAGEMAPGRSRPSRSPQAMSVGRRARTAPRTLIPTDRAYDVYDKSPSIPMAGSTATALIGTAGAHRGMDQAAATAAALKPPAGPVRSPDCARLSTFGRAGPRRGCRRASGRAGSSRCPPVSSPRPSAGRPGRSCCCGR